MDYAWDEAATREAVKGRSGGICEYCHAARGTDMHHRISRGVGGKWRPANLIHLCRACHSWATNNPDEANAVGVVLKQAEDPEQVPVQPQIGMTLYVSDDVAPPLKKTERRRN